MAYLLDTNVWIASLRGRNSVVSERIRLAPRPEMLLFCSVVKAELCYGAIRSAQPQRNLQSLADIFKNYASVPFDDNAAQRYAEVRTDLERSAKSIGPNDLMIAAIVLAGGLTLVTNNTSEFSRVPSLAIEDWQTP